jgi:hypothetical protein
MASSKIDNRSTRFCTIFHSPARHTGVLLQPQVLHQRQRDATSSGNRQIQLCSQDAEPVARQPTAPPDFRLKLCKLQKRSSGPNGAVPTLRDFDLGGAKPILPRGRSVSCFLLNQQAFGLEKEFEVDHGFHRTPLVPGCVESLE